MILKLHIELCVATKETTSEIKIRYSTENRIQTENPFSEILTNSRFLMKSPIPTQQ